MVNHNASYAPSVLLALLDNAVPPRARTYSEDLCPGNTDMLDGLAESTRGHLTILQANHVMNEHRIQSTSIILHNTTF